MDWQDDVRPEARGMKSAREAAVAGVEKMRMVVSNVVMFILCGRFWRSRSVVIMLSVIWLSLWCWSRVVAEAAGESVLETQSSVAAPGSCLVVIFLFAPEVSRCQVDESGCKVEVSVERG